MAGKIRIPGLLPCRGRRGGPLRRLLLVERPLVLVAACIVFVMWLYGEDGFRRQLLREHQIVERLPIADVGRQGCRISTPAVEAILQGRGHEHASAAGNLLHFNGLLQPKVREDGQGGTAEDVVQDALPHVVVCLVPAPETRQEGGAAIWVHGHHDMRRGQRRTSILHCAADEDSRVTALGRTSRTAVKVGNVGDKDVNLMDVLALLQHL
mmetsp:Transcript_61315/g.143514  ORF Transcript_61315/g.143514 Transcript_61315/m.143514 type:complete len:210 (+) Transcript_61315:380-1009(+)